MTDNIKSVTETILRNFLFTKRFEFRTIVPVDLAADRISEIPFGDGKGSYTTEIEPVGSGYLFDIWEGNKYQREPEKARVIGSGTITRRGDETIVQGEVRIGLNRMLMLTIITLLMSFWTFGLFTVPFGFLYLFYTGGLPIIAPLYLFWQTMKKRSKLLDEVKVAVTPHLSDRRSRLQEEQWNPSADFMSDEDQHRQRRRR